MHIGAAYPVLLGGADVVLKPNSVWQFPVVHLVIG